MVLRKTALLTTIALLVGLSFTALAQTKPHPQLKKFDFMKGEFKVRHYEGTVIANFSADGKEFRWEYKTPTRTSVGVITYDAKMKKYALVETINASQATYYEGIETPQGFAFRALIAKGGAPDDKGEVVQLLPMPAIVPLPATKMVNMVRLRKNAEGQYEKYYEGDYYTPLSPEQLAKTQREGLKRMEFLIGKFKEDERDGEVVGQYQNNGTAYVWAYKSGRNTSEAVVTYDFHYDRYTLVEKLGGSAPTETIYQGSFQDGKLVLWARAKTILQLTLSSPAQGKVLMGRKSGTTVSYEGSYTKVEETGQR